MDNFGRGASYSHLSSSTNPRDQRDAYIIALEAFADITPDSHDNVFKTMGLNFVIYHAALYHITDT